MVRVHAFRRSIRAKIVAVVLLACLAPFLAAVLLLARAGEAGARGATLAEARTAGALARALADERAARLLAFAQAIALAPGLGDALAARDRTELLRLTEPWVGRLAGATVALTDERGLMVLRTYAPDRHGDDVAATTRGLLPALRGEPGFSTEAAGLRGLAIRGFGPVRSAGRIVGVVAVTQNLDQEFLAGLRAAAGFDTFAVLPDRTTVGGAPDATVVADIAARGEPFTGLAVVDGRERAVHAWPLVDPDATVVGFLGVVFPLDGLAAAQSAGRRTAALAGLAAVAAAGLLAWLLSRALVGPVERITRGARAIAGGAPASIPALRSGDELEELSGALRSMVATLSRQASGLEELNARLRFEHARAEAVAAASRAFAEAHLDLEVVLAAVARRVAELLDGGCVVRQLSADGRWLTPVAFHHTDPDALAFWRGLLSAPQRADEGINGRAVQTGDAQFFPRFAPEDARALMVPSHLPYYERFSIRSLLVVPLRARGRVVGTLAAQRTTADRPFADADRTFLQELADRAALAIEQARLYQEVSESEARYRAVVEQSADAIVVVEGTTAVYANDAYLRLVGVADPARVIGHSGDAWLHPDDRALVNERILARQRGEPVPRVYEFRVVRADGEVRTVEVAATPIARGGRAATLAVLRDVTERTRAEAARRLLSEASAVLGSSLDYQTTLAAVARLLAPGLADWCTIYLVEGGELRRAAGAHADPERAGLLRALTALAPRRPDRPDPVRRVVETGQPLLAPAVDADRLAAYADGAEHRRLLRALDPRSSIIVPLVARGETLGALGLNRTGASPPYRPEDLAVAQQLADRCAAAIDNARLYAEARAAVAARDQFLSVAAHELRTPITAIKGHAQALQRAHRRGPVDADRLARSLESLVAAGDRLAELTDDLLDVGRIRTGHVELRRDDVDLAGLARVVAARLEETLGADHRLVVDAPTGSCVAAADAARVEQVLGNLLHNAVKYSPAGGDVRVTVRRDAGGVRVAVQDQGIGLPEGAADRIFEPFGRAANATSRHLPGMGLGLFVSRGIVEEHGGWLKAESPGEDRGTTFTFWLPCGPPERERP